MNKSDIAINFLGYTSLYKPLDDYMLSINIKIRPQDSSLATRIVDGDGISFMFIEREDYIQTYGNDPFSEGQLVLERLDFDRDGSMPLPFGLDYSMTQEMACSLLGVPLKSNMPETIPSKPWMPRFYFKRQLIVLHFEKDLMTMKHAVFSQVSLAHRKRYGIL